MGIFDGYLICSDIDGTIEHSSHYEDYKENYDAIKYFTKNGGYFTFTTGRYLFHLENERFSEVMNAPSCIFNGGAVYDYSKNQPLFIKYLPHTLRELISFIEPHKDKIVRFNICMGLDATYEKYKGFEQTDEILDAYPIKIVCVFDNETDTSQFQKTMQDMDVFSEYYICKSWNVGIEFLHKDATKGQAIQFIKNHLGNIHTLIAIGDNENDIPMLKSADVGVAVGDAAPNVKESADITVCKCDRFAVKDLINRIANKEI